VKVAIIVPWRDKGDQRRRANLQRVIDHLAGTPWPVHVVSDGRAGDLPFGRQHAYNRGMSEHPADVWIAHEADMLIPHDQLGRAVDLAATQTGLVVPFDTYAYLGVNDSLEVLAGADPGHYEPQWVMVDGRSIGAVNVVSAATMAAVGRWDERLTGHGYDDRAMALAFQVATGNRTRTVEGVGTHLWHPMAFAPWERGEHADPGRYDAADVEATRANKARLSLYRRARTAEDVRALTA